MNSTVIVKLNLNTSHVLINHTQERSFYLGTINLNTSHVLINPGGGTGVEVWC